jgi:hypothetical protein
LLLGGAKDEHFSCFLSSCQLGLNIQFNSIFESYHINLTILHLEIGNEEFLDGIKITKDRLKIVLDNGLDLGEDLTFYMNSHEECQRECKIRY